MFSFRTGNTRGTQQRHADPRDESTHQPHEHPSIDTSHAAPHGYKHDSTHVTQIVRAQPRYCLQYFSVSSGVNHSGSRPSSGKNTVGFSAEPSLRSGPAQ